MEGVDELALLMEKYVSKGNAMVRKGKKLEFISLHRNTLRQNDDCRCRMLARLSPAACSTQFGGSWAAGRIESLWARSSRPRSYRPFASAKWESPSRDFFQFV